MLDNQIPAAIHSALRAFKRPPPGEHLIENDTQRANIRIGSHLSIPEPLRRGILRREEPWTRSRTVSWLGMVVQFSRDAEVEQARRPVPLHQDVGRLQVAMYDFLPVRVLHRFAHQPEKA